MPVQTLDSTDFPKFDIGLPGWTVLTWTLAGGIMVGGVWVMGLVVTGAVDPIQAGVLGEFLFFFGAILGALHGIVLGIVGRPDSISVGRAIRSEMFGLVLTAPALLIGRALAHGIADTAAVQALGGLGGMAGSSAVWAVAAGICFLAAFEGMKALRNAYHRWPDWKVGTGLAALVLSVLGVAFLRTRPEVWGTEINVSGGSALLLALGATLWLALPAIVVGLQVLHRIRGDQPES